MRLLAELLTRWGWIGNGPWWRSEQFWLALAALVLPFGWVLFFMRLDAIRDRLQPVRVRVRGLIRR
ncbi:MAG: hypothetical protein ACRELS_12960 [Candidatus Rokuibacteriota bacterium]